MPRPSLHQPVSPVGIALRALREDLRITGKEAGELLGCTATYIYQLERGDDVPSLELLLRLGGMVTEPYRAAIGELCRQRIDKYMKHMLAEILGREGIEMKANDISITHDASQKAIRIEFADVDWTVDIEVARELGRAIIQCAEFAGAYSVHKGKIIYGPFAVRTEQKAN